MADLQPAPEMLRLLGLSVAEYQRILQVLGRTPSEVELGMFGAMWSEHCGYKHSRLLLRRFPTTGPGVVQGPGENAGAVSLGGGLLLVLKIESHNHPSAVEPFQGAATGAGGILRDIFTMGARPIAMLDSLRFGLPGGAISASPPSSDEPEQPRQQPRAGRFRSEDERLRYLFHGVVAGIGAYGNCMGIPTVGGETVFEPCYAGNPLVNAMCVGLVREGELLKAHGGRVGNLVMLVGAATGHDGIHGATFASVELDERSEERRPAVQVGDPLTEKLLLEACLELRDRGLVAGMQDLGAAGLTSSTVELADKTGSGIEIDLALVPRRAPEMTPYELMLSESQERMLVALEPARLAEVEAVLDRWELPCAVIGTITGDGVVRVRDGGVEVAAVPVRHFTDDCPVYALDSQEGRAIELARQAAPELPEEQDWGTALLSLLAHPNIGSKRAVWQQYDHMVGTNTVLAPGADAAVLRLKGRRDAIALVTDGNGRYCYLDPYVGGALAVLEAARNLACVGARPLCVTDCLNFGNPEKPGVAYQLERAIEGMADACRVLGVPVVSGNVSLYNESEEGAIYPTPIVGMAGQIDEVSLLLRPGFQAEGDLLVLLGAEEVSLGGSVYGQLHGLPPCGRLAALDMDLECRVQALCRAAIAAELLHSAHDCSDGGLAVAVAECALAGSLGATIDHLEEARGAAAQLFGEGPARILVSVAPESLQALVVLAQERQVPIRQIGVVSGDTLRWGTLFSMGLAALAAAYESALATLSAD